MNPLPIRLSQPVQRKIALERAIELLGRKYLCHPANQVKKLAQPYGTRKS